MGQSNTHDMIGDDHQNRDTYRVYSRRWVILIAFSFLSFVNNWIWITWSPLTVQIASHWNVQTASVDNLSAVYMYVYIPLSFPALYFLNRYKLRYGLIVGGGLNFIGALIRYWGMASYAWVYWGTLICALCQTLTLAMPPLISTVWFHEKERGLSTSLGVLANQLGAALGMGATIALDLTSTSTAKSLFNTRRLESYLLLQTVLSGLSLLLVLLFVKTDGPPTPPSEAADLSHGRSNKEDSTYWKSLQLLLSTKSGSVLCVTYGLSVGVLYALATFLAQIFQHTAETESSGSGKSWSDAEVGYLGLDLILVGVVGSLLSGEYLDHTQSPRGISIGLLLGSLVSVVLFVISRDLVPFDRGLAYIATGLVGFFLSGFISIGFEYGTALSYPADEAAVAGLMNVAAQIGGWVLVSIGCQMSFEQHTGFGLDKVFMVTLLAATILFVTFVTAKSQRPG